MNFFLRYMNVLCVKCKGRNLCGRPYCPIMAKISSQKKVNLGAKQDFFGETPNIFVGKYGYPNVNVGFLSTEEYKDHDAPKKWVKEGVGIQQVINLRTELVNSSFRAHIKSFDDRFMQMSQEVSLAHKPVDVEINLNKKPSFSLSFNQDAMPHGPRVSVKQARITENPKIPHKVEKIVDDDLKAAEAVNLISKSNFDEHYITKVLSLGNLGSESRRKIVPTRWSITAVDDILGKKMIEDIKNYSSSDYLAYFGGYLGNYYLVLCFPDVWRYELFEMLAGQTDSFATDYENYSGRREYAHSTAGGYYAARLGVLEGLKKIRQQASVLCLRFITNEYWAPLGVWVCRNATRKSIESKPLEFGSKELMLDYVRKFAQKKFGMNIDPILRQSDLLNEINSQIKLNHFN